MSTLLFWEIIARIMWTTSLYDYVGGEGLGQEAYDEAQEKACSCSSIK